MGSGHFARRETQSSRCHRLNPLGTIWNESASQSGVPNHSTEILHQDLRLASRRSECCHSTTLQSSLASNPADSRSHSTHGMHSENPTGKHAPAGVGCIEKRGSHSQCVALANLCLAETMGCRHLDSNPRLVHSLESLSKIRTAHWDHESQLDPGQTHRLQSG